MFCENCGKQIPDDATFCTNCGNRISATPSMKNTTEKISDTEVQLKVKPTYKFLYTMMTPIVFGAIMLVLLIPALLVSFAGPGFQVILILIILMLVIDLIVSIPMYFFDKKKYQNYTYEFYKTKVIYQDSFLNISEKEVKYKYIREVSMRQTFVQRWFNLGTILLFTNAETGLGNGVYITSVENVQEIYKKIKAIIDV